MYVNNDNRCSWINNLTPRANIKTLKSNKNCEWFIIGAGFSGIYQLHSLRDKLKLLNDYE